MRHLGKKCTGCAACYNGCISGAIKMKPDSEGFLYPRISKEQCIQCDLCTMICPLMGSNLSKLEYPSTKIAFAGKCSDVDLQMSCTSGGVFTAIAVDFIKNDGIVYGASYMKDFSVKHIRITDIDEVQKLSGSKYVQSSINDIYKYVKKDLDDGLKVLFSGTSCQVAGLRSYLKKDYNFLVCVDMICHGIPSPRIWNWYFGKLKEKVIDIHKVVHKGKNPGGWDWKKQFMLIESSKKEIILKENIWENSYMKGFLSDLYLRPYCHECKFKSEDLKRVSDLTLADYWGCEIEEKEFFDSNGISLILVNTKKGGKILDNAEKIIIKKTNLKKALCYNNSAYTSPEKLNVRKRFFEEFNNIETLEDFKLLVDSCEKEAKKEKRSLIHKVKRKVRHIMYTSRK